MKVVVFQWPSGRIATPYDALTRERVRFPKTGGATAAFAASLRVRKGENSGTSISRNELSKPSKPWTSGLWPKTDHQIR